MPSCHPRSVHEEAPTFRAGGRAHGARSRRRARASVTDPLGNTTTHTYDAVGRRLTTVDPLGNAAGGVPAQHTWTYEYDQEDRPTRTLAPAPAWTGGETAALETRAIYDAVGNRVVAVDANGQVTKYFYDDQDSLALVCESAATWTDTAPLTTLACPSSPIATIATAYTYDHLGNLARVVRALGHSTDERATDYAYDGLSRLRKETQYPNWPATWGTLVTESTHDKAGNRATLKDPLLKTTTFTYDPLNRLTKIDYSEAATPDVDYTHDAHGNRLTMADGTGTTTYTYDERDRALSVTSPHPGGAKTVGYRYDRDGNRVKTIYPDGTAVTSTFDKASRLTGLLDWASRATGYSYLPDGSLDTITHPNGTTTRQQYDRARRPRQLAHKRPDGVTFNQHDYTLDKLGNRTVVAERTQSLAPANGLRAWGGNGNGRLGDGTTTQRTSPVATGGTGAVVAAAAGRDHALALTADGKVLAWGANASGQLGLGTTDTGTHAAPAEVAGLTEVTAVAGGGAHSLALRADGTLRAWGSNGNGRLGDGTTTTRTSPVTVSGLTNVVAIAAGTDHSLALRADGTAWAWGLNTNGRLGDGTTTQRTTPTQVVAGTGDCVGAGGKLTRVAAIAAGGSHSLALLANGTVCAWGNNANGRLGDGTTTQRLVPTPVTGLTGARSIAAGDSHGLALKADGTLAAWGNNANGRLGTGSTSPTQSATPVAVSLAGLPGGARATALAAGYHHAAIRLADGTVATWGLNANGQLGLGDTAQRTAPTAVTDAGTARITALAGGEDFTLALRTGATARAWGGNPEGQLGDGTTTNRTMPVQPADGSGATAVLGGQEHSLALRADGTVLAWGGNRHGQLGDGTTADRPTVAAVGGLTGVTALALGYYHNLALKADGTLAAWGYNLSGQVGDGTTTDRTAPVAVGGLTNVVAAAAGVDHSLVLKADGTVWAWGDNGHGQLGNGTQAASLTPVQVKGPGGAGFLTDVAVIATMYLHNVAVKHDGSVWAWGYGNYGQLGDGNYYVFESTTPVQVLGPGGSGYLTGIKAIRTAAAAGDVGTLAVRADGTVWTWGGNEYGQLGDGSTASGSAVPVQVSGLSGVAGVAAGQYHALARKADGTLWAWGANYAGQLGASTTQTCYGGSQSCSRTPLQVPGLTGVTAAGGGFQQSLAITVVTGAVEETTTHAYDGLSRLTTAATGAQTTSYAHDTVGNRASRARTGTTTTSYTYDRADPDLAI